MAYLSPLLLYYSIIIIFILPFIMNLHCDESERAVPGSQPGCQWSNFSWPGILFISVGWIKPCVSPEVSRVFWKLVCCTCSQAGIFLEILLTQPGIFKKVRCTCSQTGVFREYSLSQPRPISKFIAFPRKKDCQHRDSTHSVLPLHHQFWLKLKHFFVILAKTKLWFMIIVWRAKNFIKS